MDATRESRLRRMAKRQRLVLQKSRIRTPNLDNEGGYMIFDPYHNNIMAGRHWDLTLDEVEAYLSQQDETE